MLLLRGATTNAAITNAAYQFQYMLLLRGATTTGDVISALVDVSIHAPLARSNFIKPLPDAVRIAVSIHAPLARSNTFCTLFPVGTCVSIHAPLARSNRGIAPGFVVNKVSIHAPLARSNRGNINRSGSKCKSKNRAKYQLSFVKEHYCILRFLIIV